ncbi:MAG: hypothetical protein JXL67_01870 [Calditrichaeota bacterium]|nr:hypothetical protein [Calditrichota bacterium]
MIPKTFFVLILAFIWVYAQDEFKPASACGECHQEIHLEWITSLHSMSTVQKDPLFRGMYNLAVEDTDGKLKEKCIVCHSPMATVFQNIDTGTRFNKDGVTCQFCHSVDSISGFRSAKDFVIDLKTVYSDSPDAETAPHPVAHRDFYTTSDFCLPCHAEMENTRGLDVCSTGEEWKTYFETHQETCQDCHMPEIGGVPSHMFPGSHRSGILENAVNMELAFDTTTSELKITLTNAGAGHAIPTGTPLRMVFLKVAVIDSAGKTLWQNWSENPIMEDKEGLFMKILGDSAGNGPVPPWKATQILFEKRLMPDEPVTVEYPVDHPNAYGVDVKLMFRYAPPPILKRLDITNPHYTQARVIVQKGMNL